MSFSHWISVAVVAFLPLAATAQQSQQANPADANIPVPTIGYVSGFENYRTTPTEKATPDQLWRAANEEITGQDMHSGHMSMPGMEPAASGSRMSMPNMQHGTPAGPMSKPGMSAVTPEPKADAVPSDPHAGHHNMQGK